MAYGNFPNSYFDFGQAYDDARDNLYYAITNAYGAFDGVSDPVDKLHFGYLVGAVLNLKDVLFAIGDFTATTKGNSYFYSSILWSYYDRDWYHEPEEFELTADKIAEAWIKDDFAGRAITIAVIDRMRQILWDEPFNVIWAARPED